MSPGANGDADTAPWADLPQDLCHDVLDRADAISIIRFPAVCSNWAAASKNYNNRPRPLSGTPMLLTSSVDPEGYDFEYNVEPGAFGFHDITTGKSYHSEAEGLKKRTWIGGKDDWLVTTDLRCNLELFNPITGTSVLLPSFATIPGIEVVEVSERNPGVCFDKSLHCYQKVTPASWFRSPSHRLQKVTLCRKPTHLSGYLVVALFSSDSTSMVAFTTDNGDKQQWTLLKNPDGPYYLNMYTDVTVHEGKVLAVARSGDICSWDMDDGTISEPTILSPPPEIGIYIDNYAKHVFYLATSSRGDLQLVSMLGDRNELKDERLWRIAFNYQWSFWPRLVLLHELDAVTGVWRRVRNLGGSRALFVGANYPFYADVPRDGSRDPLPQEDCVYVADLINCEAGFFDLKLGDDFDFERNWDAHLSYPTLNDPLQMPMWFRPTAAYLTTQVPIE